MAVTAMSFKCDRCGAPAQGKLGIGPAVPDGWISLGCASTKIVATPVVLCVTCFAAFADMMRAGSERYEFRKPPKAPAPLTAPPVTMTQPEPE